MNDVNARNAESFRVALAELAARVHAQDERIDQQNKKIATMNGQIAALTNNLNMLRVAAAGTGPTRR